MTKWYAKKLIYCHCFSFWRQLFNFYQPSLDKYNTCLCRTITALFSTFKIARTCFCCVCIISLTAMSKHRSWGGASYIYIYIRSPYLFRLMYHLQRKQHFRPHSCSSQSQIQGLEFDPWNEASEFIPENRPFPKRKLHKGFQPSIFNHFQVQYVSFREKKHVENWES